MPVVETWRRQLWNKRASSKQGYDLSILHGISFSTYFALRNKGIDTIEELLDLVDKIFTTRDRFGLAPKHLNEIADAIELSHTAHLANGARYKLLQHKVKQHFARTRLSDEMYTTCMQEAEIKRDFVFTDSTLTLLLELQTKFKKKVLSPKV